MAELIETKGSMISQLEQKVKKLSNSLYKSTMSGNSSSQQDRIDMSEPEEALSTACVASNIDRFDDMFKFLQSFLEIKEANSDTISYEECGRISVAFKNLLETKHSACRSFTNMIKR